MNPISRVAWKRTRIPGTRSMVKPASRTRANRPTEDSADASLKKYLAFTVNATLSVTAMPAKANASDPGVVDGQHLFGRSSWRALRPCCSKGLSKEWVFTTVFNPSFKDGLPPVADGFLRESPTMAVEASNASTHAPPSSSVKERNNGSKKERNSG